MLTKIHYSFIHYLNTTVPLHTNVKRILEINVCKFGSLNRKLVIMCFMLTDLLDFQISLGYYNCSLKYLPTFKKFTSYLFW